MAQFTTPAVGTLTGASFRQLDYWARTGTLVPSIANANGSGTARRYTPDDVRAARVICALSRLGATGAQLAHVADAVRNLGDRDTHLIVSADGAAVAAPFCAVLDGAAWVVDLVAVGAHRDAMTDEREVAVC